MVLDGGSPTVRGGIAILVGGQRVRHNSRVEVQMRMVTFLLSDRRTGRQGHGLICPHAGYASTVWRGTDRIQRRQVDPRLWSLLTWTLQAGLPAGPLPTDGAIVRLPVPLNPRRGTLTHYLND